MSDLNKDGVTDIAEATAGGAEHIAAQQAHVAEVAAAEEARRAAAGEGTYPREYNAHSPWTDDNVSPPVEFVGTQYSYNTEAEALSRIDQARAAGKYVMYMAPPSYVASLQADDHRVTIED